MPKIKIGKYYAVRVGRDGPRIYDSWDEFTAATFNFSGFSGRSFPTIDDAQKWLDGSAVATTTRLKKYGKRLSAVSRNIHQINQNNHLSQDEETILKSTSSPTRANYPNSGIYWTDYSLPDNKRTYVNTGVQCSEAASPCISQANTTPPRNDKHHLACKETPTFETPVIDSHDLHQITLSPEQQQVLDMVKSGQNVFFTGPAGTGKSVLLREIIKVLKPDSPLKPSRPGSLSPEPSSLAVTASTGIAGLNIGGTTVHSFAGIRLGKEPAEKLAEAIKLSGRLRERWQKTRTLIIDEISMVDAILFDKLEYIARTVRGCLEAFGGIQLVLSGDFCQLPPVPDKSHAYNMPATYAFDATSWPKCISKPILLSRVFRQKDNEFVNILAAMRIGRLTPQHVVQLQRLARPLTYADGIEPSQLFPLRMEVERCNNTRLDELVGSVHTYLSMDSAGHDVHGDDISKDSAANLLTRLVAPSIISLKVGAQVMLIQNVEQGALVNGSVGKVVDFMMTRQALERHIEIAQLVNRERPKNAATAPEIPQLVPESNLCPLGDTVFGQHQAWPMVRFTNGRELLCAPLAFTVEGFMGNVEARRLQVPLILAWALSIHKSQGQTLSRVKVDLSRIFEKGQAYVAISRATTMECLEIQNFHPIRVQAHPRVLAWQSTWMDYPKNDDEMDCEEAIARYWDQSDCSQAPPK